MNPNLRVIVFDINGTLAHFKKIYATTSAVSYVIPTKTAIYGYIGAVIGLDKDDYLRCFPPSACRIGIIVQKPIIMRRLGINLRAEIGRRELGKPPKPTLTEFVSNPHYRIIVHHTDPTIFQRLKTALENHAPVFTPSLGLANLLSNFEFQGVFDAVANTSEHDVEIHSVIPKRQFIGFSDNAFGDKRTLFITEQSMYALEMDTQRNVTERDDILLERKGEGSTIPAKVKTYYHVNGQNIILF